MQKKTRFKVLLELISYRKRIVEKVHTSLSLDKPWIDWTMIDSQILVEWTQSTDHESYGELGNN